MEEEFDQLVKVHAEQQKTSKDVEKEYKVSNEEVVIIDEDATTRERWSETSCRISTMRTLRKKGQETSCCAEA